MVNFISNAFKTRLGWSQKDPSEPLKTSKIPEIFSNATALAVCAHKERSVTKGRMLSEFVGGVAGTELSLFSQTTGAMTGLHEVVGHGLLGLKLTSQSSDPTYQVDGWDTFNEMRHSGSFKEGITNFFQWIFGSGAGSTSHGRTDPNGLGEAMGPEGRDAWISLTGSLPALALDTVSVVSGMHLRKRSPILGNALVGFGLMNNMLDAGYPISAAMMSKSEMETQAATGHDFANFALQMSAITGAPAQDIAIGTAAFWTGFVPIVALIAYLRTKAYIGDAVPDVLALNHWLQKAKEDPKMAQELETYYESYPRKELLARTKVKDLLDTPVFTDFINYLLEKLPPTTLDASKKEVLASWEKNLPRDRIQTALTTATVVGVATAVASKTLNFLALAMPSLQSAATILSYVSIVLVAASVLSAAYQVYKDHLCPDSTVPKTAKMLSVANLVVTVACAALIAVALLVPGLNVAFLGALIVGCVVTIVLNYKRSQIIRTQFALSLSMSPDVWNVMYPIWQDHQKKIVYPISRLDSTKTPVMGSAVKTWADRVSEKEVDLYCFQRPIHVPRKKNASATRRI